MFPMSLGEARETIRAKWKSLQPARVEGSYNLSVHCLPGSRLPYIRTSHRKAPCRGTAKEELPGRQGPALFPVHY